MIRQALAPGGRLFLIYQPFSSEQASPTAEKLSGALREHGFEVESVAIERSGETADVCVVAAG